MKAATPAVRALFFSGIVLCFVHPATAQTIYRSVDESGNVTYSDRAPSMHSQEVVSNVHIKPENTSEVRARVAAADPQITQPETHKSNQGDIQSGVQGEPLSEAQRETRVQSAPDRSIPETAAAPAPQSGSESEAGVRQRDAANRASGTVRRHTPSASRSRASP